MNGAEPIIVYDTICSRDRTPWLANDTCHDLLVEVWTQASAWLVGRYVVMPDHIHLFAAPGEIDVSYRSWVKYWKRLFTIAHGHNEWRLQDDNWDTRLRRAESYAQKWDYVRQNPVRAGLAQVPNDWPYQGKLNQFRW